MCRLLLLLIIIVSVTAGGIGAASAQSLPATESAGASPSLMALAQAAGQGESAEAMFQRMDGNHDGLLSAEEFKAALKPRVRPVVYQRLPAQFRAFDLDHSGYLEANEFAALAIIRDAGAEAPSLAAVDTSQDARIDFREFVAMAAKLDPAKLPSDSPSASPQSSPASQERSKRRGNRVRLFHMQVMAARDNFGAPVN
jgi:Ca2+-binding EF-hand superfamily protein